MTDMTPSVPGASPGQVVFVKTFHVQSAKNAETLSMTQIEDFVDSTSLTQPDFLNAFIYTQIGNPSMYSVYETRTGTRQMFLQKIAHSDVSDVLRSSVDWYNPIARWQNPPDGSTSHQFSFIRLMRLKPGKEARETVLKELYKLIEVVIQTQSALKTSVVHESLDNPDEIMLYEEWNCSQEQFIAEELPKPYRAAFRQLTDRYFVSKNDLEWLGPVVKFENRAGTIEKTQLLRMSA